MSKSTPSEILFYQLTEIIIAFIGAVLILAIWKNIRTRFRLKLEEDSSQKRIDKGLLFLSLAIFVWVAKSIFTIGVGQIETFWYQGCTAFFSLMNSLFFVLALFYFDHAPGFLYQNRKNTNRMVVLFLIISIVSLILFAVFDINNENNWNYSTIPDIITSAILSYLLMYAFFRTFKERKLMFMAYFSLIALALMFVAQLPEIIPFIEADSLPVNVIRIVTKSALISLCLVLATTWVIELAETPAPSEMSISFLDWSLIELSIPSKGINKSRIDFKGKHTQFRNLLKFAVRRKYAPVSDHCIEIMRSGEIQGQVYLTRIVDDINKSLEESKAERKDIFTFIGMSKYRVRFLPENITIDTALLHEFVQDPENSEYGKFVGNS